ncbi:hypothetical protein FA13DRAFT_1711854, partial [Coprinellus micaceus]
MVANTTHSVRYHNESWFGTLCPRERRQGPRWETSGAGSLRSVPSKGNLFKWFELKRHSRERLNGELANLPKVTFRQSLEQGEFRHPTSYSVMALDRVPTRSNGGWPKGRWNSAQQTLKFTQWRIPGAANGRPTAVNESSTAVVGFVAHATRRQRPSNGDAVGTPVSKFATIDPDGTHPNEAQLVSPAYLHASSTFQPSPRLSHRNRLADDLMPRLPWAELDQLAMTFSADGGVLLDALVQEDILSRVYPSVN